MKKKGSGWFKLWIFFLLLLLASGLLFLYAGIQTKQEQQLLEGMEKALLFQRLL